jgi:hypothetical protein
MIGTLILVAAPLNWKSLKPGENLIPSHSDLKVPAIEISGNNLVIDGSTWILRGTTKQTEPDQRKGLGIRVRGKNITLKNLKIHGYKVALLANGCENLKLINCDFSYNWKQRLASTPEKEDLSDWMSYHQNEKDEWLRYGAAAYFKGVNKFEVKGLKVTGGQNGLMLMKSNNGLIWNSDISFNSAVGIGMYRSSNNRVMHNNINFCVRGYSHGVYNRGQDSAGILVYEQSNKNVFAYNSVTHGGDGFFLWAGQTTMDTGKGGCNDNLVFGNDFSYAPTNGIEATFSRNIFANNYLEECWHGFWTGYSYDSVMSGNFLVGNEIGIAHEHGQNNTIDFSQFRGNKTDIRIWANEKQDPNWGYPKFRNTKSENWKIKDNVIHTGNGGKTLDIKRTKGVLYSGNTTFEASFDIDKESSGVRILGNCVHSQKADHGLKVNAEVGKNDLEHMPTQVSVQQWTPWDPDDAFEAYSPDELNGGINPFKKYAGLKGRKNIIVDEWGPYDFKAPKVLPSVDLGNGWRKLSILGPKGKWSLKSVVGLEVKSRNGTVPGSIQVRALPGVTDQKLDLTYTGSMVTDYRGIETAAGKPVQFGYSKFELPIDWKAKVFTWDKDTQDPRTQQRGFDQASALQVVDEFQGSKLDFAGYGKFTAKTPATYFGVTGEGEFEIKPGEYIIEATTDDGLVLNLDDQSLISEWKYQGPTQYTRKVKLGAKHKFTLHYFQIDGYATLRVKVRPAKAGE